MLPTLDFSSLSHLQLRRLIREPCAVAGDGKKMNFRESRFFHFYFFAILVKKDCLEFQFVAEKT